ncbi:MAG: hypothetical protein RIS70_1419, partial [Planctomycetota bacterium]
MAPYRRLGSIPPKRHIHHRTKPGYRDEGIYYEEVVTSEGFDRAYSILYHLRPPTRVKHVASAGRTEIATAASDVLRHIHLKSGQIPASGDPITGRVPLFVNSDVVISRCRPATKQLELYRNAVADEVLFVHRGQGRLITHFGILPFRDFDYIVIPKCTTYLIEFDNCERPSDLLVIEANGRVRFPSRYLNPDGQLRLGAPFSERDLHGP